MEMATVFCFVVFFFVSICNLSGCNDTSIYGSNCDNPCPTNCKLTCHIQNGTCFRCKHGWTGVYCNTKCGDGWYGNKCSQQCLGHCRDDATCNHVTGQCDKGCAVGWTELQCNEECYDGTYGYDCVNNCSSHCLNYTSCNKQTGYCDRGCNPGYTNNSCNKECPSGHFGLDCREHCRGYCRNNEPCDHVSGICPSGCQHGYIGAHCNNACEDGYFGSNCSQECSLNCKSGTCRPTDGWCICSAGWMGYNCTTVNCKQPCNINCINQTCDRIDGSCLYGCKEGERCDKDIENYPNSFSSSDNLPITVGSLVCACVLIIIGAGIIINVIRLKSSGTMCNTGVLKLCLRSTPAAEESVGREDLSNYQELNFSLQENHYQCISR